MVLVVAWERSAIVHWVKSAEMLRRVIEVLGSVTDSAGRMISSVVAARDAVVLSKVLVRVLCVCLC